MYNLNSIIVIIFNCTRVYASESKLHATSINVTHCWEGREEPLPPIGFKQSIYPHIIFY